MSDHLTPGSTASEAQEQKSTGRRRSRLRMALLASTALSAMIAAGATMAPSDAAAACGSADNSYNTGLGGTRNNNSGTARLSGGLAGTLNLNGNYSVNDCILQVTGGTGGTTFNVNNTVETTAADGIVITRNRPFFINVNGTLTAGTNAIIGGNSLETVSVNGTANGNFLLNDGLDSVFVNGGTVNGNIDGGGGVLDNINLLGDGTINGDITNVEFLNVNGGGAVNGTSIVPLTSIVGGAFQVTGGNYQSGLLNFAGNGAVVVSGGGTATFGAVLDVVPGGSDNDLIVSEGTLNLTTGALLGGGVDRVSIGGDGSPSATLNAGIGIDFGEGDDVFRIFNGGTLIAGGLTFGGGNDRMIFTGDGDSSFDFGDYVIFDSVVNVNVPVLGNIPVPLAVNNITKNGTGAWTLVSSPVLSAAESLTVNGGTLNLTGNWVFTGNTITVNPNTTLNIGPGFTANLGDTNIGSGGTLNVLADTLVITVGTTNINRGTLAVNAGGAYTALSPIFGSNGQDTIIVDGALIAPSISLGRGRDRIDVNGILTAGTIDMGRGDDVFRLGGVLIANEVRMGRGDDTFIFNSNGGLILPIVPGGIDGGNTGETNGDNLVFTGTVDNLAAFALLPVSGFENLVKNGSNTWTLTSLLQTTSFETLTVNEGTLNLLGFWEFTGNTTNVLPLATLNIGPFAFVTEAGDVNIGGTLNVNFASVYTVGGTTTVFGGGELNVNFLSSMFAQNVDVLPGGTANINGLMTAADTRVGGVMNIGPTGIYTSFGTTLVGLAGNLNVNGGIYTGVGAVTVQDAGILTVNSGLFNALSTTTVQGGGAIVVNGGFYTGVGPVLATDSGSIIVNGGLFTAGSTTTVQGDANIVVDGGAYLGIGAVLVQEGGDIFVNSGLFTAVDTTTVQDDGNIVVSGGAFLGIGPVLVQGGGDIFVNGGLFTTLSTTTVQDDGNIVVGGGTYIGTGAVFVRGNGDIFVNSGSFNALSTTTVRGNGNIVVAGGTYRAGGAVLVRGNGDIFVNSGLFNAFDTTTVRGDGNIVVDGTGVYRAQGAVLVRGNGDIFVNGDGLFNAQDTTTVRGDGNIVVGGGTYRAGGPVLVRGNGDVFVNSGLFNALSTTTVRGNGNVVVAGGTYRAQGDVLVRQTGDIFVNSGLFNAFQLTTVRGDGNIVVDGTGTYRAQGAVLVRGNGDIFVNGDGLFNAQDTTTVRGDGNIVVGGGTYRAGGSVLVRGNGDVFVNSGLFNALSTTTVRGNGNVVVAGGTYRAQGDVLVRQTGDIFVNSGLFNAFQLTTVRGDGNIVVDGTGTYRAQGAVLVRGNGDIFVNGDGLFNAQDTTTVDELGDIVVSGGIYRAQGAALVQGEGDIFVTGGLFNAFTTTTVQDQGDIFVNGAGAVYRAQGPVLVRGSGGSIIVSNGLFNGLGTTTVQGSGGAIFVQGATAEYRSAGDVLVRGSGGSINVSNGLFNALAATTAQGSGGTINVTGATAEYRATGAVVIQGSGGFVNVTDGLFNALSTTNISSAGARLGVFGDGVYTAGDTITMTAGLIFGTGTINGGQVLNNIGGTVAPGASIGTLFFVGTYNQGSGGNFQAELQPGGPSDLLDVTGSAALLGNVELSTLASNFGPFQQNRIIRTDNPIPTIFETATVTGAGLGSQFAWVGRVDNAGVFNEGDPSTGNNVDVIIATSPGALKGLTPNQQAVANYLGTVAVPGGVFIEEALPFLIAQVVAGGPNALDQIGGEVYDSFTTFAFDTARQYGRLVDNRVRTLRCAAAGGGASAFCDQGMVLLADAGPDSIPTPGAQSPKGFSPNTHPYGWSIWASAIGSRISLDQTSTNLGYSGYTGGGVMGVDLALSRRWIVGIMVGGSKSNIDFSGVGGDGDLSNVGVGVYTAWYGKRWFADASFTYSKNWIESSRELQFGTVNSVAKGKTQGDQFAAHATLGYGFVFGKTSLELSGGVDWVQLRQYGFTETGAGAFNLTVNTRTDDSLRLRIGGRVAHPFKIRQGLLLVPHVKLGYAREILDNTRPITSSLGGIPGTFTVNGDEGSRNILTFGAGVKAAWSQGISLSLNYNGEWAGDRQGHGVTGTIRVRW